jgi:uncharacterized protein with HEPN domain
MAAKSALPALEHIAQAIVDIETMLAGSSFGTIFADRAKRAAIERWIEIVSEASRRIPTELKAQYPEIPWPAVAAVGNILRHDYDEIAPRAIEAIVRDGLPPLKAAIDAMIVDWRAKNPTP